MNHLFYKLPWNLFSENLIKSIIYSENKNPKTSTSIQTEIIWKILINDDSQKAIRHFAKCFVTAVKEFSSGFDPKKYPEYIPFEWPMGDELGGGAQIPHISALISNYIQLNLLLLNRNVFEQIILGPNLNKSWIFDVCMDKADFGLPNWIGSKLEEILEIKDKDEYEFKYKLKPFDRDITEKITELNKLYFRCIYAYDHQHKYYNYLPEIDVEFVLHEIELLFGIKTQLSTYGMPIAYINTENGLVRV